MPDPLGRRRADRGRCWSRAPSRRELAAFQRIRDEPAGAGRAHPAGLDPALVRCSRAAWPARSGSWRPRADAVGRGELDVPLPRGGRRRGGRADARLRDHGGRAAAPRPSWRRWSRSCSGGPATSPAATSAFAGAARPAPSGLERRRTSSRDRYEILSALGEGGMGQVFRVRDRELDDEVALKVLKPEAHDATAARSGCARRSSWRALITHPNVVRVHDFGESDGHALPHHGVRAGHDAARDARRGRGASTSTPALQIAKQICRGLAAVHKAGIIHGDLKPQNVMVMGNGVVKLMDFGVARAAPQRWSRAGTSGRHAALHEPRAGARRRARRAQRHLLRRRRDVRAVHRRAARSRPRTSTRSCACTSTSRRPTRASCGPTCRSRWPSIILACLAKSRLQRPATRGRPGPRC